MAWSSSPDGGRPPRRYERDTGPGGPPARTWSDTRRPEWGDRNRDRDQDRGPQRDWPSRGPRAEYPKRPYRRSDDFGGPPRPPRPPFRAREAEQTESSGERRAAPPAKRPFYQARFDNPRPVRPRPARFEAKPRIAASKEAPETPVEPPPSAATLPAPSPVTEPASAPAPSPVSTPAPTRAPKSSAPGVAESEASSEVEFAEAVEAASASAAYHRPSKAPRRERLAGDAPREFRLAPQPEIDPEDTMPTAYLKPGEADRIAAGHPWIYEGCVLRLTRDLVDGDVIQVKDHRRRFLGVGFYNSQSRIRIRLLHPDRRELDEAFFAERLEAALAHRRRFLPDATSFRVVNAEGDRLSGLIVDKYEDVLVMQTTSLGMDRRKSMIVGILQRLLQPRAILERNDMASRRFEGLPESNGVLAGELSEAEQSALPVRLNGLRFEANLLAGHKTGLYLDQQINHARVASYARGARVLDAFSFIGGFALSAAKAGASSVIGIDQSEEAIATARRLAALNGVDPTCTFEAANVFDWLRSRLAAGSAPEAAPDPARLFDLVILDPPSFTRNRASIPDALRGYKEIHLRALRLLRPGGILATFCCSHHVDGNLFQAVIAEAAFDARRQLRRLETFTQSPDHPILSAVPETEYLKGAAFEVLGT